MANLFEPKPLLLVNPKVFTTTIRALPGTLASEARYFDMPLSASQIRRHDNGALVSCGLTCPTDLRLATLRRWIRSGQAREITFTKWNR